MTHRSSIVHLVSWLLLGSLWLLGCAEWQYPEKLAPRECNEPNGTLDATPTLLQVQFNLKTTGTIDKITWNFGDNSPIDTIKSAPQSSTATITANHSYTAPGTYTVVAKLTNVSCEQGLFEVRLPVTVSNVVPPTVVTQEVTDVLYTTAAVKLNLTSNGNAPVTRYGVCWSATNNTPTKADSFSEVTVAALPLNSPVTLPIAGLQSNTVYYFRAFAQNANTIGYGEPINKRTGRFPSFGILEATATDYTDASVVVRLTEPGAPMIAEYGITFSTTNQQPTPDNSTNLSILNPSVGVSQTLKLANLESGKRYWVRSYARTPIGLVFGEAKTFDTPSTLTRDLVLYLPFSDADGNPSLNDASGRGNNASMVGGALYVNDGQTGKAIKLDGFNDYIFIPDNASLRPTDALSVSVWIRPNALDSTMQIFNKSRFSDSGGEQYSSKMRPNVPNKGDVTINTDIKQGSGCLSPLGWKTFESVLKRDVLATRPLIGNWNHIVFTYRGNVVKTYLNGELVNFLSNLGPAIDDCPGGELKFGAQIRKNPDYFNGSMDEIRVYRRELTPDEVKALNRL